MSQPTHATPADYLRMLTTLARRQRNIVAAACNQTADPKGAERAVRVSEMLTGRPWLDDPDFCIAAIKQLGVRIPPDNWLDLFEQLSDAAGFPLSISATENPPDGGEYRTHMVRVSVSLAPLTQPRVIHELDVRMWLDGVLQTWGDAIAKLRADLVNVSPNACGDDLSADRDNGVRF